VWWHNRIQGFIFLSWEPVRHFHQVIEFAKVYIEEISSMMFRGDAVLDLAVTLIWLISLDDAVPDIQQVAEVGVKGKSNEIPYR
jgi:hypothetical protein